jgi:hypothetical protein
LQVVRLRFPPDGARARPAAGRARTVVAGGGSAVVVALLARVPPVIWPPLRSALTHGERPRAPAGRGASARGARRAVCPPSPPQPPPPPFAAERETHLRASPRVQVAVVEDARVLQHRALLDAVERRVLDCCVVCVAVWRADEEGTLWRGELSFGRHAASRPSARAITGRAGAQTRAPDAARGPGQSRRRSTRRTTTTNDAPSSMSSSLYLASPRSGAVLSCAVAAMVAAAAARCCCWSCCWSSAAGPGRGRRGQQRGADARERARGQGKRGSSSNARHVALCRLLCVCVCVMSPSRVALIGRERVVT